MIDDSSSANAEHAKPKGFSFEFGGIEDLPDVMRIMERAFPKTYGESWNNNQSRSMLSLPRTQLLLAKLNNSICGFAICRAVAGEQELLMIAVDPDFRQMGVATSLLQEITTRAEDENIEVIFLEVRSNNPAQSLYQRHGFEKIGVRAAYYTGENKAKYDAITYRKLLKNSN
ncbi:MAG: ribosomal protein S18-alanine N-acetyltransferase [Parasphingorhabdus sp.]